MFKSERPKAVAEMERLMNINEESRGLTIKVKSMLTETQLW